MAWEEIPICNEENKGLNIFAMAWEVLSPLVTHVLKLEENSAVSSNSVTESSYPPMLQYINHTAFV
jgi:hypothetical protein